MIRLFDGKLFSTFGIVKKIVNFLIYSGFYRNKFDDNETKIKFVVCERKSGKLHCHLFS